MKRIATIRQYMDTNSDSRKIVGTVAGAIVPKNVLQYAQSKGLFVIIQTGEAVAITPAPEDFNAREW